MLLSQACQATSQMDMAVNYRWNLPCFPAAVQHRTDDVLEKEVAVSHSMAWMDTVGLVLFSHLPFNTTTNTPQPSLAFQQVALGCAEAAGQSFLLLLLLITLADSMNGATS